MTRDHIPPQCFFEKPSTVINQITVPCCESCRRTDEFNDGLARNLIISTTQAESHRVVESQLASSRNRAIEKYGQLPHLLKHVAQVDIHSPEGDYLGSVAAFDLKSPVIDAFLHRMVRGLFHSVKKSGFVHSRMQWRTNVVPDDCEIFGLGTTRTFGDVFSYTAVFSEETQDSLWLLTFYERVRFIIHMQVIAA